MTQEAFVRSLLRITIIQLLRSIGFNRSPNSLVDILTDLYIRYFELLLQKTKRFTALRDNDEIIIQDISAAIDELALIRPSNPLDLYDIDPINGGYAQDLEHWCFGDIPDRARDMSKPNLKYIRNKRIEDLKLKLNRIGLGSLINTNTYAFSSKTKEEIELEKLLNNEIVINVPEDYLQYLLNGVDKSTKQKLKHTFLGDELYDDYNDDELDETEMSVPQQQQQETVQEELKAKQDPPLLDHIVFGPTPQNLEAYLPYNDKSEIKEFDVAKYLNAKHKNLAAYQAPARDIEFHDEFEHKPTEDQDGDKGFQLGGW